MRAVLRSLAFLAHHAWNLRTGRRGGHVDRMEGDVDVELLLPVLDRAAETWHTLPVGGSVELGWPWPEHRVRRGA